jgi:hypothetical protein
MTTGGDRRLVFQPGRWRKARAVQELHELAYQWGLQPNDREGIGRPAAVDARVVVPELPEDTRPWWLACRLCLRPMAKRRRVEIRPGALACRCCASLEQPDPHAIAYWLTVPLHICRVRIMQRFQLDPISHADTATRWEWSEFYLDSQGDPLVVIPQPTGAATRFIGMPNMFWNLVEERGPGVL